MASGFEPEIEPEVSGGSRDFRIYFSILVRFGNIFIFVPGIKNLLLHPLIDNDASSSASRASSSRSAADLKGLVSRDKYTELEGATKW